ncbi:MAG: NIPSNAP family protein [Betaproteobacteria bacterium]
MIHELRVYRCMPGKLPDLNKRFESVTLKLWEKHGFRPVGFWTTVIGESNQDLTYLLEWKDLGERERVWAAFMGDQEWLKARAESEKNGAIVANIASKILAPTAFSKIK